MNSKNEREHMNGEKERKHMDNGKEKSPITTLLDIYHPIFREGYQDGRKQYFQEHIVLNDKQLVELLQSIFEESQQDQGKDREEGVYYSVGRLMGQVSGYVIPLQPSKDNTQEQQEAFLANVMQMQGETGKILTDTIRQFWAMQDQLAQTLDADTFEQMLRRGAEQKCCL